MYHVLLFILVRLYQIVRPAKEQKMFLSCPDTYSKTTEFNRVSFLFHMTV